jgi:hypothetical protein
VEFIVDVEHVVCDILGLANLDIIIVPTELLVGLWTREELGSRPEKGNTSNWNMLAKLD